jgi:hypothetical protein
MTTMRKVGHLVAKGGRPTPEGVHRYPANEGYYIAPPPHGEAESTAYPCTCVACCAIVCRGECDCMACSEKWAHLRHAKAPNHGSF